MLYKIFHGKIIYIYSIHNNKKSWTIWDHDMETNNSNTRKLHNFIVPVWKNLLT